MLRILKEDSEQLYQSKWKKTLVICLKYFCFLAVFIMHHIETFPAPVPMDYYLKTSIAHGLLLCHNGET
jgi:hypothetical protein